MKLTTVVALTTVISSSVNAKVSIAQLPQEEFTFEHADAVGQAHTDAFEMLTKKYEEKQQRPKSQDDMLSDLSEIMASFCDEESTKESCTKLAREFSKHLDSDGVYPDDFNEELLVLIDDVYTTVNTMQEDNVGKILQDLDTIKKKMREIEAPSLHKHAALAGVAVAMESTKLWTKVYSDSSHPLLGLHHAAYYAPPKATKPDEEVKERNEVDVDPMHGAHRRLSNNCIPPTFPSAAPSARLTYKDGKYTYVFVPGYGWIKEHEAPDWIGDPDIFYFLWNRFDIIDIIQADIDGAVFGLFEAADDNPVVFINPQLMFQAQLVGATTRSAAFATTPPTASPSDHPSNAPTISCAPSSAPSGSHAPTASPVLPTSAPVTTIVTYPGYPSTYP